MNIEKIDEVLITLFVIIFVFVFLSFLSSLLWCLWILANKCLATKVLFVTSICLTVLSFIVVILDS